MQTHSLELARHAIELEAVLLAEGDGAHAQLVGARVYHLSLELDGGVNFI